jgi:hypothetical protein
MLDFDTGKEYDLDHDFGISDIKNVIFYEDNFYIMANKMDQKLGYYLLKFPEKNPSDVDHKDLMNDMYIMNCKNKPVIGAVDMSIYKDDVTNKS